VEAVVELRQENERLRSDGAALYEAYTGKSEKLREMSAMYQELKGLFVAQVRHGAGVDACVVVVVVVVVVVAAAL